MARDMTDRQFKDALARNGFKKWSLWFVHSDYPNIHFGGVFDPRTMKLHRRATVAQILKRKAAEDAKREKARKSDRKAELAAA